MVAALTRRRVRLLHLHIPMGPPAAPSGTESFASTLGSAAWQDNSAFHDAGENRDYFCWQDQPGGAGTAYNTHARVYDHVKRNLLTDIITATNGLVDDNHGTPTWFQDTDGYLHMAYGSHNSAAHIVSSAYPNDHAQWVAGADHGSATAYLKFVRMGNMAFLCYRDDLRFFTIAPCTWSSGVLTVGTPVQVVDFGAGTRFYAGNVVVVGNDLHVASVRSDGSDTERRNIHYYVIETDGAGAITGARDFDDTTTIAAGDFPVDLTESEASFRIYTHPGGELWSTFPQIAFDDDASEHPHVVFSKGADASSVTDILHIWHNGAAWQPVDTVELDTAEILGGANAIRGPGNTVEIWYYDDPAGDPDFPAGGNMYRSIWDAGVISEEELIREAGETGLAAPMTILTPRPDLRVAYRALAPSAAAYAHGDSGPFLFGDTYTAYNEETAEYFAKLATAISDEEKFWIDRMVSVAKEIGIAKYSQRLLLCMGSEADALLDLFGNFDGINNGASFAANVGFTTNGSSTFVDTGLDPTLAAEMSQNSNHFDVFIGGANAGNSVAAAGWFDTVGGDGFSMNPRDTASDIQFRSNQAAVSTIAGTFSSIGHLLINRSGANATQAYKAGATLTVTANANQASVAFNAHTFRLGSISDVSFGGIARTFCLSGGGASLTAEEAALDYNKGIQPFMHYKGLI